VILPIYEWETPASHYPEGQSGRIYLYRDHVYPNEFERSTLYQQAWNEALEKYGR